MKDRVDLAQTVESPKQFALVQVVGDLTVDEVTKLVGPAQIVDRDNVGDTTLIERMNEIAANEAGGSSHDDHRLHSLERN